VSNDIEMQPEIVAAEEEVRRAREALVSDLHAVSASSKRVITNVVKKSRPLLVGACVLGGIAVLVGVTKLLRRRPRPLFALRRPPSLPSTMMRAALTTLVRAVAVRVAERASLRVGEAALHLPSPEPERSEPPPPAPEVLAATH
jgi:hypothetical protein